MGYQQDTPDRLYVRSRHFSPAHGLWLSRDPLYRFSVGRSRKYVRNNPVRFVDPTGLKEFPCHLYSKDIRNCQDDPLPTAERAAHCGRLRDNCPDLWQSILLETIAPGSLYGYGGGIEISPTAPGDRGGSITGLMEQLDAWKIESPRESLPANPFGSYGKPSGNPYGYTYGSAAPSVRLGGIQWAEPPTVGESLIPVYGPLRTATHHWHEGHYVRTVGWSLMALSDAFMLKSLAVAGLRRTVAGVTDVATAVGMEVAANQARGAVKGVGIHLTGPAGASGIAVSKKIGGRFGVFALDEAKVPATAAGRRMSSWVAGDVSCEVRIGAEAAGSFTRPPWYTGPVGLFRASRGVRSTPLGSVDLLSGEFIAGQIYTAGKGFHAATVAEYGKYLVHQLALDNLPDALLNQAAKGITWGLFEEDTIDSLYMSAGPPLF